MGLPSLKQKDFALSLSEVNRAKLRGQVHFSGYPRAPPLTARVEY